MQWFGVMALLKGINMVVVLRRDPLSSPPVKVVAGIVTGLVSKSQAGPYNPQAAVPLFQSKWKHP